MNAIKLKVMELFYKLNTKYIYNLFALLKGHLLKLGGGGAWL